jgi:hypothetical protein
MAENPFYTGDVNFENQTIMTGADFPEEGVDYLLMETTRGDSPTPVGFSRANEEERFSRAVREAITAGGTVTIPVFALGKTQEVLALLWQMRLRGGDGEYPCLYWRSQREGHDCLRCYGCELGAEPSGIATASRNGALCVIRARNIECATSQEGHLRLVEWNDDGAYPLEYFCEEDSG